jgi:hypothetical protein
VDSTEKIHEKAQEGGAPTTIKDRQVALKGCLKKRPDRIELVEKNILKGILMMHQYYLKTAGFF